MLTSAGVVLRLNDDGSVPVDNPFFGYGALLAAALPVREVGTNVQKIFSYGHRNSFGIAVDPYSGQPVWLQENGDDTFSELNRAAEPGLNGGWIQIMGPVSRMAPVQARSRRPSPYYEPAADPLASRQHRGPRRQEALSPAVDDARARTYVDPEFSWRYEVAPGGIGFIEGHRTRCRSTRAT
jgi:aldose sugar dehydrogenase